MLLSAFKRVWNDTRLMRKTMITFLLFSLVILLAFLYIVYMNVNVYYKENTRKELEKTLLSSAGALEKKMTGFESAAVITLDDDYFQNLLYAEYTSTYALYYDLAHRFDPAVSSLRMYHPEFIDLTIYTEDSDKIARQTFRPLSDVDLDILSRMNAARSSTCWVKDGDYIYFYWKVYDAMRIRAFSIVAFRLDCDRFLSDIGPAALENYVFNISDQQQPVYQTLQYDDTDSCSLLLNPHTSKNVLTVSSTISCRWALSLSAIYGAVPLSALISELTFIVVGFCCILIAFLVSLILTKSIVNRILRLNDYVSTMVEDEFSQELLCDDRDEVGSIIRNVNSMARQTRRLINENYTRQLLQNAAEIKMLQAQINPHFLYNTLSVLNWNAINHGDMETSEIITSLSAFYRSMIGNTNMVATLEQELTLIQSYLRIRRVTCRHSFEISVQVPDSLLDYELPHITLQPIVENAIDHGIEINPMDIPGRLSIEATETDASITIIISDNGPGMSSEQLSGVLEMSSTGYGLSNVNARLKLFFAPEYGIELCNLEPHGLKVCIHIPKYVSLS